MNKNKKACFEDEAKEKERIKKIRDEEFNNVIGSLMSDLYRKSNDDVERDHAFDSQNLKYSDQVEIERSLARKKFNLKFKTR